MWPEAPRLCNAEGVFYRVLYLSLFRKTFSEGSSSISYMDSEGSRMSVHDNIYHYQLSELSYQFRLKFGVDLMID